MRRLAKTRSYRARSVHGVVYAGVVKLLAFTSMTCFACSHLCAYLLIVIVALIPACNRLYTTWSVVQHYMTLVQCLARYHLGSIALGSFIIAIIQFIRAVLEYIDRQMKAANPGNVVLKYLMTCARYTYGLCATFRVLH